MAEELGSSTVLKSRNEKARKELVVHANTMRASQLMSGGIMGLLASKDTTNGKELRNTRET